MENRYFIQDIYRCPKPKRSEPIPETLFDMEEAPEPKEPTPDLPSEDIARAIGLLYLRLDQLSAAIKTVADAIGLPANE